VKRDRRPPQLIRPPPRERSRDCFQNHRRTTVYPYDLQRDDAPTSPPDPSKSSICPVVIAGAPTEKYLGSIEAPVALGTLPEFFADALPALRGPSTASSSLRPGPRPTSSAPMAGDREDSACADKRRTGTGKRSHSLRPSGTTGSTRLASLMDRSTAKASNPISRSSSCRRSSPATWSSWTISAATRAMRCAGPFVAARLLFLPRYSS